MDEEKEKEQEENDMEKQEEEVDEEKDEEEVKVKEQHEIFISDLDKRAELRRPWPFSGPHAIT